MLKGKCYLILSIVIAISLLFAIGCETGEVEDDAVDDDAAEEVEDDAAEEEADDMEDYFAGETITMICPHGAGGGYDTYTRLVARYLEDYLNATVIVENESGAGGVIGRNKIYHAEPDGLTIGLSNYSGMIFSELAEAEGVEYKMEELTSLARVAYEAKLLVTGYDSEFETLDDVINADREVTFGHSGVGSDDFYVASFLGRLLGFEDRHITGYEGSGEVIQGVITGDVDLASRSRGTFVSPIEAGEVRPLTTIGSKPDEEYDIPIILEYVEEGTEEADILKALIDINELERAIFGPPDMPDEMTAYLREALDHVFNDPDFLAEAEDMGRPIEYLHGDDVGALVSGIMEVGELIKEDVKEIAEAEY